MLVQYSDGSGDEAVEGKEQKNKSSEQDKKPKRKKKNKKRKKQADGEQQLEDQLAVGPDSPGTTSTLPSMEDIMKGSVAFVLGL